MTTRDPETIRHEIEDTREQLGETVEALAEKADVKAQAKAKVDEAKERVTPEPDQAKKIGAIAAVALAAAVGLIVLRRRR